MIRYYKIIMTGFITYLLVVTFSGWGTGGTYFLAEQCVHCGRARMYSLRDGFAWEPQSCTLHVDNPVSRPLDHGWSFMSINGSVHICCEVERRPQTFYLVELWQLHLKKKKKSHMNESTWGKLLLKLF